MNNRTETFGTTNYLFDLTQKKQGY